MPTGNTPRLHSREGERADITRLYATACWLLSTDCARSALDLFRTMVAVWPGDERAWLGLGEAHERLDGPEIAVHLYTMGCRATRGSPRCHLARARALAKLDRRSDAQVALDAARVLADIRRDEPLVLLIERERNRL